MSETKNKVDLIVISGPSGVGKSSIIKGLLKRCPRASLLVSATTRKPRPGEKDGINYYFISEDEFKEKIKSGDIPEYRFTPETRNYYGTYLPDLRKKIEENKIPVADVDIIGAKFFKENFNPLLIFIMPPSEEALISRIQKRNDNMPKEELEERLKIAKREIKEDSKFYDYKIVNEEGKLQESIDKLLDIVRGKQISC